MPYGAPIKDQGAPYAGKELQWSNNVTHCGPAVRLFQAGALPDMSPIMPFIASRQARRVWLLRQEYHGPEKPSGVGGISTTCGGMY